MQSANEGTPKALLPSAQKPTRLRMAGWFTATLNLQRGAFSAFRNARRAAVDAKRAPA
jgi:hypothetical protein